MPIDAIITLDRLVCSKEHDETGHSEPYLWPVLIRIDDETLATPALVSAISPSEANARSVVKSDMRRGDAAPVPEGQRVFRFRFSDGLDLSRVLLVVALLENDETPQRAIVNGYTTFRNELPKAIGSFDRLLRLSSDDAAVRDAAIGEVKAIVGNAVRAAIRDSLTAGDKLKILLGTLDLDDEIAVAHTTFDRLLGDAGATLNQPFNLLLVRRTGSSNSTVTDVYDLRGRFETRRVVRDRCQPRVDAVRAAQEAVDAIEREIDDLRESFKGDELAELVAAIQEEDLDPALAALDAARAALAACRATRFPSSIDAVLTAQVAG